ncbi:MAG TPA: proline racemase family protein [Geminicoccaceae bacterium]|nr:proline racemase family protein [Geminicoccaceae bacterium]
MESREDRVTLAIETIEMHTGGEPVRIVTGGWPAVEGATLQAKRRFVHERQDDLRRFLMHEPRGHHDMYGVLPVAPDHPDADLAVLFMHNEGWSTMCGHAVIALGRYAVDRGIVPALEPETEVRIQCPCGLVRARVQVQEGRSGAVGFTSVPAFAFARDAVVETREYGPVTCDIGFGGAFYAVLPAAHLGLDVLQSPTRDLVEAASMVSEAAKRQIALAHPDDPDLAFLYGTILTDDRDGIAGGPSANICVFANRQVDRSPTGSGVTARMALLHRRGRAGIGEPRRFRSITGAVFEGRITTETRAGPYPAVTVEVRGRAHYTGRASFGVEADDPLGWGFSLG